MSVSPQGRNIRSKGSFCDVVKVGERFAFFGFVLRYSEIRSWMEKRPWRCVNCLFFLLLSSRG